ncbi:hypothetical protein N9L92_04820 [Saprospiraceae bacterium]|nr:hypothetical protein [Saprospiraceae bacterium]
MKDIQSYVDDCTDLIQSGYTRDDIDQYLNDKSCDPKTAAAIHLQLQYIFVQQEKINQRKEEAWSNIAAGGITLLINTLFTIYTIITGGYVSLLISAILVYIGWKYLSKGWKVLNNLKDEDSIFEKKRSSNYIPKR